MAVFLSQKQNFYEFIRLLNKITIIMQTIKLIEYKNLTIKKVLYF